MGEQQRDLYTIQELSRKMQVSTKKLREWKRHGVLHPIRLERISGPLKYSQQELERFIEEHTINKPGEHIDAG